MAEVRQRGTASDVEVLVKMEEDGPMEVEVLNKRQKGWRPHERTPWLAALLSAIIPGLGQLYNYQVLPAIIWWAVSIVLMQGIILPVVYYVGRNVGGWIVSLLLTLLRLGVSSVWKSPDAAAEQITGVAEMTSTAVGGGGDAGASWVPHVFDGALGSVRSALWWIINAIQTFPAPPMVSTGLWVWNFLYGLGTTWLVIIGLAVAAVYLYQVVDAYLTARRINANPYIITHSRKMQLVSLFATTALPYILIALPIPGSTQLVSFFFCSSKTIKAVLDAVEKAQAPPSELIYEHLMAIVYSMLYQFACYTIVTLASLLYSGWYFILIANWAYHLFF